MQPEAASKAAKECPVRSLRRRLTPQAIEELVARYNAGEHTPALSREYGISKTGLLQLFQAEGVLLRRRAMTPEDAAWAMQLYESGLTIKQVVGQVGYSFGTVQRALYENGVAMRAAGIGKRAGLDQR